MARSASASPPTAGSIAGARRGTARFGSTPAAWLAASSIAANMKEVGEASFANESALERRSASP